MKFIRAVALLNLPPRLGGVCDQAMPPRRLTRILAMANQAQRCESMKSETTLTNAWVPGNPCGASSWGE